MSPCSNYTPKWNATRISEDILLDISNLLELESLDVSIFPVSDDLSELPLRKLELLPKLKRITVNPLQLDLFHLEDTINSLENSQISSRLMKVVVNAEVIGALVETPLTHACRYSRWHHVCFKPNFSAKLSVCLTKPPFFFLFSSFPSLFLDY
jgi:hypothetical protein